MEEILGILQYPTCPDGLEGVGGLAQEVGLSKDVLILDDKAQEGHVGVGHIKLTHLLEDWVEAIVSWRKMNKEKKKNPFIVICQVLKGCYSLLYHSYQDCPIDFHIRQSVPFHDHDIVPPTI